MGKVVDLTKKQEQIFVRSACCNAPWELTRLNGVWKVICDNCGKGSSSFIIQGPDMDGCTCDECKKKLT